MQDLVKTTVTVATGASLSGASAELDGRLVGIQLDAEWDTNAVTFQMSLDGSNWSNVYKEGTEYSLAGVVASSYNSVDMNVFLGARYVKARSGTAGSAVNQSGATVVTLVLMKFI